MWTTKIGTAKRLDLGLGFSGALVNFVDLVDPVLEIRLRNRPLDTPLVFPVTAYTGELTTTFNASVEFTWGEIVPGVYLAEVDAVYGGELITFPDTSYLLLQFIQGLN